MPDNLFYLSWALIGGAVALALAACIWALAQRRALLRLTRNQSASTAQIQTALGERNALLSAGREALIAWTRDGRNFAYGGADKILQSCLEGADALPLSTNLDQLSAHGRGFALTAREKDGEPVQLRGRAVGSMAAVWLDQQKTQAGEQPNFAGILEALPVPVWIRDRNLTLRWANRAFLQASGESDLDSARNHKATLDKSERDLAGAARTESQAIETRRFAVVGGQRRALNFTHAALDSGDVLGSAIDVTEVAAAEARLQQHIDAHADMLDKLLTAVAIFDREQKLNFYNRAFVKLWALPENWLDKHPTYGEMLDRLREMRRLPERRDFQAWKREYAALFEKSPDFPFEELWHLPSGLTLRVVAQPHPFGGLTFLYEDVTERLALESSYNTLAKVQTATLDTLKEGVAVFGPDGKLKLSNAAFLRMWQIETPEIDGEPHIRRIAAGLTARFGQSAAWDQLVLDIVSGSERARDWGTIERSDRAVFAVSLSPLPDAATLVTFSDVTDRFRVEAALRERNQALEAADRLKSDFIKHVSYELRTPLNTVLGYAEHLSSQMPGALNAKQVEYMQAIVSASNTLHSLVNDILDLALVESGALRLSLEEIDLFTLLSEIATHARDWAAKGNLKLELNCSPLAGMFWADGRRVRQVVFNLLSNAFKYTPRGGVVTLSGAIADDVIITVADTGPGIAPEMKANVFERFASRNRSGQRAGAGLGLALVDRFVSLHSGWVEIESKPNEGTVVRCHFPRRTAENPRLTDQPAGIHAA